MTYFWKAKEFKDLLRASILSYDKQYHILINFQGEVYSQEYHFDD